MTDTSPTQKPGAYLMNGSLFFRMPDRSTILCNCIGEPFSKMIVDMWSARQPSVDRQIRDANWRDRCGTGEELA